MSDGGCVVWLTGLPGSGKSLLAQRMAQRLRETAVPCVLLDAEEVQGCLAPAAGTGPDAFHESLTRLAALLAHQGLVVLVAATAARRAWREGARGLAPRFYEVYLATPPEECARREAGRRGAASPRAAEALAYEPPERPDVVANGGQDDQALGEVIAHVRSRPLWP